MIWLTWRQFRASIVVAATALAAFAVILGLTGPDLAHLYATSGLATCRASCGSLASTFLSQMRSDAIYPLLFFAGGAALYLTPALIVMFSWWSGPIDQAGGFPVTMGQLSRFSPLVFDARGLAPVGYAAFAFTLGVTVVVLIRRTLPAMAIALACIAVVQL